MKLTNRPRNRSAGLAILSASVILFIIYAYALLFSGYGIIVMEVTMLAAIGVLLTVLGWIGYTMLTAPRPEETT